MLAIKHKKPNNTAVPPSLPLNGGFDQIANKVKKIVRMKSVIHR
jgi:hypothetical protein